MKLFFICLAFVFSVLFFASGIYVLITRPELQPGLVDGYYSVARVIDGDTIELTNVGPLRFADIDAPELDEPGGAEAKAALVARIDGRLVYVTFDRRGDGMPQRGRWGRLLGHICTKKP